jgi:hypothetical protein
MSDESANAANEQVEVVPPEVLAQIHATQMQYSQSPPTTETVTAPAKVMRIGSMVKQLLEEVRASPLDEASRERLAEIYERSIVELGEALSSDLQEELRMLALPFRDGEVPSDGELRVAQAQLVGWLEGLFHGIQATLFAQQVVARQQLEQMRQIPTQGAAGAVPGQPQASAGPSERPGQYL